MQALAAAGIAFEVIPGITPKPQNPSAINL